MADAPPLLTKSFLLLVLGHFLQGLGWSSMLLLPLYLDRLQASRTEVGAIMAMASVGGLLSRPLVAWALDRVGRRPTLLVGTALMSVGMLLLALITQVGPLVYGVRVLFGLGQGAVFTGYFTVAADVVPAERRAEGLALFGLSGLVPLAINAVIAFLPLGPGDLRWVYPAAATLVAASLFVVARLPEPAQATTLAEGADAESVWRALRRPALLPVWLATAAFSGVMAVLLAFLTVIAARRGVEFPAAVWLPYAVGAVGVRLVVARAPDRLGVHNLIAPALAVYVGAALVAALADTDRGFLLAGLLGGAAHGMCFPLVAAQAVGRAPARWRGSVMALFTAIWQAGELIAPPLCGAVADRHGDATMLVVVALTAGATLVPWVALEHVLGRRASPAD